MSDSNNRPDSFREAVCVEAQRIFDSCSDKDCLQDLPVTLDSGYVISNKATIVKCRFAEVSDVCINVEPVPFNKGFYSVDITYTFKLTLDTYEKACGTPTELKGTSVFTKKVILFGSEGSTKTFYSNTTPQIGTTNTCGDTVNLPQVSVQVVEPIVLDTKFICCPCTTCCDPTSQNGIQVADKSIVVTLGLFSIVQVSRTVAVLVPVYDYCMPQKECTTSTESPCEMFDKIKFPTNEFFPPALEDESDDN